MALRTRRRGHGKIKDFFRTLIPNIAFKTRRLITAIKNKRKKQTLPTMSMSQLEKIVNSHKKYDDGPLPPPPRTTRATKDAHDELVELEQLPELKKVLKKTHEKLEKTKNSLMHADRLHGVANFENGKLMNEIKKKEQDAQKAQEAFDSLKNRDIENLKKSQKYLSRRKQNYDKLMEQRKQDELKKQMDYEALKKDNLELKKHKDEADIKFEKAQKNYMETRRDAKLYRKKLNELRQPEWHDALDDPLK